ncbi:MAG: hydrogenase iron-sulfur subunit [Methanomassiliicoccales archaeon]|nr:MAG: hydrogenase iron-sulfur subunit [Methanomassiliicoccales archaeon]
MDVAEKKSETGVDREEEEPRIGVYVCHCGLNIAGSVDVEAVADYAAGLPNVVLAKDYRYSCSDPGQEMMKEDIKEQNLNRLVVASCSPRLHEPTFRAMAEEAGMNRYLVEMANIREHCSWVHLYDKEGATEKAKELVKMAVNKARLLQPQVEKKVPVLRKTAVIGAGVAGIQAALDLADSGYKVYLIEKDVSIGGRMAQIDKTFPTMDCSICILAPKMSEVGRHPNVELLTNAEVEKVSGYVGNFVVTIRKKARYVRDDCTACGDCATACPVVMPNEFDLGLASRKAIYTPFAQAVPSAYVVDIENCLNDGPVLACEKCIEACDIEGCIDFNMKDEVIDLEVGTIVIATGSTTFDAKRLEEYGYGKYPNVLTTLEFERLINAGGPSGGHLIRPSDLEPPKNVAFIQCIGSRTEKDGNPYCSNICCMETIKDALLIKEHWPEIDIVVYYMDIRAFGKGFEDLYKRARTQGVRFIRGIPAEALNAEVDNIRLIGENTLLSELYDEVYDMVILSIGIEPQEDSEIVQRLFNLSKTADGFFMESHPKLLPVDTPTKGVFLAGCAESPKDIKDSVTQACAAASRANILMAKGEVTVEAITPIIVEDNCNGCGLCVKVCPYNAIELIGEKPNQKAKVIEAACTGCGTCGAECKFEAIIMRHFTDEQIISQIDGALEEDPEKKILAFACNWCSYAGADFAGVSRMQYPSNVRIVKTMCSGRVSENFVRRAFEKRAGAVLVSGCHLQDCHYINANYQTKKRVEKLWKEMDKLGLDKSRLHLEWFTAAEGQKFADKITEMKEIVEKVDKKEIDKASEVFKPKKKVRK